MSQTIKDEKSTLWRDQRAIALLLAASLTTMANATISPALAGLQALFADHPHSELLIPLLVSAPSLTVVLFAPLAGILTDRLGRRWMLLAGVLLFVISGTAGSFLTDLDMIFGSRLVLGIAVAMIMTSQTALVGDYFTGDKRVALTGLQVSARNFGGFLFISLAGWLAVFSPKLPFAIYGLAAFFLPFMWFAIHEPRISRDTISPRNNAALSDLAEKSDASNWVLLIALLTLLQMATNMLFFIMPTQLPFFLDMLGYDSAVMTGMTLGALTLSGGFVALIYGRIKKALGFIATYAVAYGLMAAGFAFISQGAALTFLFAGAVAIGAGFALAMPGFVAIALQLAPQNHRGIVGGALTTAVFLGQFLSPLISTPSISALGYESTLLGAAFVLAALAASAAILRGVDIYRQIRKTR